MAKLVQMIEEFPSDCGTDVLTEDAEGNMVAEVNSLLAQHRAAFRNSASNGLPDDTYQDILAWVDQHHDYYSLRTLLCTIDSFPGTGLDHEVNKQRETMFSSLNGNAEETGILILPKVKKPATTYLKKNSADGSEKEVARKNAFEWSDNLNERLNYVYYMCADQLNGYHVANYVYNFTFGDSKVNELRIGVAPLINTKLYDTLDYDDTICATNEAGLDCRYFNVNGVKVTPQITHQVEMSFHLACEHNVDILMFPEMLGVEELYDLDSTGFNPYLRRLSNLEQGTVPHLILMPSLWRNNQNQVLVLLDSGRKLCTQHKQYKYLFPGALGNATENLKNIPKEINLIHVPGWGRIAILICIDFLHAEYRQWLVRTMKADILLCPSYSPGEYNFLQCLDADADFGVHTVWLNSCSALHNAKTGAPELVGAVSTPSVSSQSRITRLIPTCGGDCAKGCLFVISLPLNCAGDSNYENRTAQVLHVHSS